MEYLTRGRKQLVADPDFAHSAIGKPENNVCMSKYRNNTVKAQLSVYAKDNLINEPHSYNAQFSEYCDELLEGSLIRF